MSEFQIWKIQSCFEVVSRRWDLGNGREEKTGFENPWSESKFTNCGFRICVKEGIAE